MSGSTTRSGRLGKAVVDDTLLRRLTQFTINSKAGESAWGDSDSEGHTNRQLARKDRTGKISGKFDTDEPVYNVFEEGDFVKLVLWEDPDEPNAYWVFPSAMIQTFDLVYDQDTQEVVGWTADFGEDGKSYKPGEDGAPAETFPD